jgi:hypothetical protein
MAAMSTPEPAPTPLPTPAPTDTPKKDEGMTEGQKRAAIIIASIIAAAALIGLGWIAYILVNNPTQAASVRDVFIIFMALEFMLIGAALVILIVQLAVLTNMLQHEIKPILESTNETVNTVRGTTLFVSENLVEPIMKLNSYVAALSSVMDTISAVTGLGRRPK